MKQISKAIVAVFIASSSLLFIAQKAHAQEVSVQVFYDKLSPYGQWVNYDNYGYAWHPSVSADFVPYGTNGHWVYSDAGWTWVSDYDWGWATFHYGRWAYDDRSGWLWIPDTHWGPAWVAWRQSNDYFGWAPLGPGMRISANFNESYYNRIPAQRWMFVRQADIVRPNIRNYYVNRSQNTVIIKNTTIIKNTIVGSGRVTYAAGPNREQVQRVARVTVPQVTIRASNAPGKVVVNNNTVNIYRPVIKTTIVNAPKPAPARVVKINEISRPQPVQPKPQPKPVTPPHPTPRPPVQTHPQAAPPAQNNRPPAQQHPQPVNPAPKPPVQQHPQPAPPAPQPKPPVQNNPPQEHPQPAPPPPQQPNNNNNRPPKK